MTTIGVKRRPRHAITFEILGNQRIASWMNAPESQFLLKFVRPDFLMLRTLAKGLILWNDICPTKEWIDSHVPVAILRYCMVRPEDSPLTSNIDYETINQVGYLIYPYRHKGDSRHNYRVISPPLEP